MLSAQWYRSPWLVPGWYYSRAATPYIQYAGYCSPHRQRHRYRRCQCLRRCRWPGTKDVRGRTQERARPSGLCALDPSPLSVSRHCWSISVRTVHVVWTHTGASRSTSDKKQRSMQRAPCDCRRVNSSGLASHHGAMSTYSCSLCARFGDNVRVRYPSNRASSMNSMPRGVRHLRRAPCRVTHSAMLARLSTVSACPAVPKHAASRVRWHWKDRRRLGSRDSVSGTLPPVSCQSSCQGSCPGPSVELRAETSRLNARP